MAKRRGQKSVPQKLESYKPHPHQIKFHQSTAKYRAMVSGFGAGKTRMGIEEIIKWTQIYAGSFGVIGRLNATSLRETTQKRFFEALPRPLLEDFNKNEGKVWVKTNKWEESEFGKHERLYSEILFKQMEDSGVFGSMDLSWFYIDEQNEPDGSGEVPQSVFDVLMARLRYPIGPWRGIVTSNSGGKNWLWRYFFNPATREKFKDFWGMQVPTIANAKYLPVNYVEDLMATHDEVWVKRFLEGSFDAFEGQVWAEFDDGSGKGDGVHTFDPNAADISPHWIFGAGYDFGITAPTACVYGAIDQDGVVWVYDEDYVANANIPEFAQAIKDKGFEIVEADPATQATGINKKSPADMYLEEGVLLNPAPNDEEYFMTLFRKMLREIMPDGKAKIRISYKCTYLIEQIKAERWSGKTLEGTLHDKLATGIPNHARDAFKYLLNQYGMHPEELNVNRYTPPKPANEKDFKVNGNWEHHSFLEDEDMDKEDYPHSNIKMEARKRWL